MSTTPYTSDPARRERVIMRLREIVADLNDTSPECLSALDSIRQIELENEVDRLRAELALANDALSEARAALGEYDRPFLHDGIASLRAEVAAAKDEAEKAKADTERLDWLETEAGSEWAYVQMEKHGWMPRHLIDACPQAGGRGMSFEIQKGVPMPEIRWSSRNKFAKRRQGRNDQCDSRPTGNATMTKSKTKPVRRMYLVQWADGYSLSDNKRYLQKNIRIARNMEGEQAEIIPVYVVDARPEAVNELVSKLADEMDEKGLGCCYDSHEQMEQAARQLLAVIFPSRSKGAK